VPSLLKKRGLRSLFKSERKRRHTTIYVVDEEKDAHQDTVRARSESEIFFKIAEEPSREARGLLA